MVYCNVPTQGTVSHLGPIGETWVNGLLSGNRRRFRENLRMSPETWHYLQCLLIHKRLGNRHISINEKMARFFVYRRPSSLKSASSRTVSAKWLDSKSQK